MSFFGLTPERVREVFKQHTTIFFNSYLQPVEPKEGQWFCEIHLIETADGEEVAAEAIVEYLGASESAYLTDNGWVQVRDHRVASEYDEGDRRPYGDLLILQGAQ
jgi:hypothetical protein